MFFDSIAIETFFNLINENSYDEEMNKKVISFLPRHFSFPQVIY